MALPAEPLASFASFSSSLTMILQVTCWSFPPMMSPVTLTPVRSLASSPVKVFDQVPVRVGIVDDDPMICQAMSLILTDYSDGRIVVAFTAVGGEDAVRQAAEQHPDVVLMDIAMPDMDGIAATRRMRALPRPPHVLMLTSLSPSNTVEHAVEAGAEGFVSKTDAADKLAMGRVQMARLVERADIPLRP